MFHIAIIAYETPDLFQDIGCFIGDDRDMGGFAAFRHPSHGMAVVQTAEQEEDHIIVFRKFVWWRPHTLGLTANPTQLVEQNFAILIFWMKDQQPCPAQAPDEACAC